MKDGVSPWKLNEMTNSLYTISRGTCISDYDYSDSMNGEAQDLREVVYDVLSTTHPGTLVRAEYRLCAVPPLWRGTNEGVHLLQSLEEGLIGPEVRLAKTLRPDQQAALRFVVDSEKTPKVQKCLFKAFVRASLPSLSVGWYARLKTDGCLFLLTKETKAQLARQSITRVLHVLSKPGLITCVANPERGERSLLAVGWTFPCGTSLSLAIERCSLEAASPSVSGALFPGSRVRLRNGDPSFLIGTDDVGVLTKYDADGDAEACFPQCFLWRGRSSDLVETKDTFLPCAEVRISVEYRLFGSVCGQKMGWGKTPLMVALMKHKFEEASARKRRSTSLVIVPPKLFRQWVNELREWLGFPAGTDSWMTTPDGMTIWAPVDMAAFKDKDPEVARTADIVVLPHTIFSSKKYPAEWEPWPEHLFCIMTQHWDRLILDEAHEISGLPLEIQRRVLAVRSDAVHALSGTPQQGGGSRGAASLALTFGASLCPKKDSTFNFHGDEDVTKAASEFFGSVARTQNSPFQLPVAEHVVSVQLSDAEKVLYANLKEHGPATTRELLELCCCFVSEKSASANKEIGVIIKQKQRELETKLIAAKGHAAFVLLLSRFMGEGAGARLASRRKGVRCRDERKECWEAGRLLVDELFEQLEVAGNAVLAGFMRFEHVHGFKSREMFQEASFKEKIGELCAGHICRAVLKEVFNEQLDGHLARDFVALGSVKKPLAFLERSMAELAGGGGSCPICLDGLENGEATCMTGCGHVFHEECISDSRRNRPECPNCRQSISEVYATKPPTPVDPWLKYGTKVKVMIQKLRDIMRDYPGERLLLFVQYRDMRKKLEQAFREFEVPFLTLSGSARTQGSAITRWQSGKDPDDFLMMLSCEEHNSGITLTRARPGCRDVIFVFFLHTTAFSQAPHAGTPLQCAIHQRSRGHGEASSGQN
jgi:SNF2-related domain/Ring finger domain